MDKNCPPTLKGRVDKIKQMYLRDVYQLVDMLEVEAALEEAYRLDTELANKTKSKG